MRVAFYVYFRLMADESQLRPANILLSERQVPVLVDFGFSEKYDLEDEKAFRSNLTYGTPEVCLSFLLFVHIY